MSRPQKGNKDAREQLERLRGLLLETVTRLQGTHGRQEDNKCAVVRACDALSERFNKLEEGGVVDQYAALEEVSRATKNKLACWAKESTGHSESACKDAIRAAEEDHDPAELRKTDAMACAAL